MPLPVRFARVLLPALFLAAALTASGRPAVAESAASPPAAAVTPPVAEPQADAAAAPAAPADGPAEVKVGMYITQLLDFDMSKRSYYATYWLWFLHSRDGYDPHATIEIANAKSDSVKFNSLDTTKGVRWSQEKHSSVIAEDWDVVHFPFDRQKLHILIEDGQSDTSQIRFVADTHNSRIDPSLTIPGWTIEGFDLTAGDVAYQTSYGDPTISADSVYSRVVATITVKREGVRLLCSLFVGFGVAFLLSMLTFFLDFESMAGSRVGLCAAAVFAAVGNKYALDNYIPPASTFTLADVIVSSTFVAILLAALAVVGMQVTRRSYPVTARVINAVIGLATLAGFVAVNAWAIVRAAA
ncbi:hypothetical protein M2352_005051 [Azospirillum fermentarium]|uniref:hypothetical protein n=1 Tax=Azospirillum fermentarium TaxID=1233114 RepID=UPI0022265905|nr:hypothetical protein [Azospirillum fermentarium]MCW2249391.1 hypothetical protein [Azospirillum fermentarium]